jgi:hypothetical protein
LTKEHLETKMIYKKYSTTNNGRVEVTKWANKLLVVSIDDIHVTNLKIENCHSQKQEIEYFKMKCANQLYI